VRVPEQIDKEVVHQFELHLGNALRRE